jgi:hypothetical protein
VPTGLTSTIVTNEALQQIAAQTRITSLTDGSPAANAASVVYAPTVQILLRELDPDFARYTFSLVLSAAATPIPPWAYEYVYPTDMLRLRQVRPPNSGTGALTDPNDPQPVRANVAYDPIGSPASPKVILTNQQNALAVYTTSLVTEAQWDSVFTDAIVRRLANPLAMALSGRPDFAKTILEQSAAMAQTAEAVDEGGFRMAAR